PIAWWGWDYYVIGNRPIRFYARVVDEQGTGLAGVSVAIRLTRETLLSIPFPFNERVIHEQVVVVTDANGDLEVLRRSGCFVDVIMLTKLGYEPDVEGIDTAYSYSKSYRGLRGSLPNLPERRVTYPMKRLEQSK
ncbi:MAG TPA: hypothetical protein VK324_07265, partial [Tepidisphaeraceae bacterium]|nr:hypothetical protein [Tepidisphaeraceae bacterium]